MNKKWIKGLIAVIISVALLVVSSILAELEIIQVSAAITLIVISVVLVWVSILFFAKIDYETGIYECRKCGHTFKPTFKAYILGAHTLTTRYLKCHKCEEKSWCKLHRNDKNGNLWRKK